MILSNWGNYQRGAGEHSAQQNRLISTFPVVKKYFSLLRNNNQKITPATNTI